MKLAGMLQRLLMRFLPSERQCPVCGWSGYCFSQGGGPGKIRFDARCPSCDTLERHRLAYLVAKEMYPFDYASVLHVAPEPELSRWLEMQSVAYLSIDLYAEAMQRMDITNLTLDSECISLLWASHVLEHVEDDMSAIREIYRVLKFGGAAFIQVPMWRVSTFEDFARQSSAEREELFYQRDHVRLYGMDIVDRFESVGFRARVFRAQDFGPERLLRHGLSFASTQEVFVFEK